MIHGLVRGCSARAPRLLQVLIVPALLVAGQVSAQQESTGMLWLGLGGGHSDNIRRTATQPDSGSFRVFSVTSDVEYESARIDLEFAANLERRMYSVNGVQDETFGDASFELQLQALPDRIVWVVEDEYGQGRIDAFEVSSPDNRAEVNRFAMGPRFHLPIGSRNQLRFELLHAERSVADATGLDSESLENSLSYVRSLDSTTEFSFNHSILDIEYDGFDTQFETEATFLAYAKVLSTGEAYLAVGTSRTESETTDTSTPFINLRWSRDIAARSRVQIELNQQYVDFFDDIRFGTTSDAVLDEGIYEQQYVAATYIIDGERNTIEFEFSTGESTYLSDSAMNYDETAASASWERRLSRLMRFGVGVTSQERKFQGSARADDSTRWEAFLERSLGDRISLRLDYQSIDDTTLLSGTVEENQIRLAVRFAATRAAAN